MMVTRNQEILYSMWQSITPKSYFLQYIPVSINLSEQYAYSMQGGGVSMHPTAEFQNNWHESLSLSPVIKPAEESDEDAWDDDVA